MKTVIFCTVKWRYENEKYERFSMDKERYADFKDYVEENIGKIIQEEEIPLEDCEPEFQTQFKQRESDLTQTEKDLL